MQPDPAAVFHDAWAPVTRHIGERYGVRVEVAGIAVPLKGDLDGTRIMVGERNTPGERLFLVAHLFGHTVQWNLSAELRRLGMTAPMKPTPPQRDALEAYEREACRYSQQAMHEAGARGLDQWLADRSACDLAFLRHFHTTGIRRPFGDFWQPGEPLIEPLAIPSLHAHEVAASQAADRPVMTAAPPGGTIDCIGWYAPSFSFGRSCRDAPSALRSSVAAAPVAARSGRRRPASARRASGGCTTRPGMLRP